MHLTFAQAYKIVCPDGGVVTPESKKYADIMELMRQSGHQHYTETLAVDSAPKVPRTAQEAQRFIMTPQAMEPTPHISKRQWMSVDANRQAFIKVLNKNKTIS